ncbi:MAG TPA: peptidylprolyl isomerase, partial [Candidatus Thermoplasmatota archaeon]|nr:peptidylprolyl isomerase [Candidatus Thermoplasmatota archaeon]
MRVLATLLVLGVLAAGCAENNANPPTTTTTGTTPPTAPGGGSGSGGDGKTCVSADGQQASANPTWVLETTKGVIRVTLFCDKTPLTAQHFVNLTQEGYFDGTKFHRVIEAFMNQGGDPLTKDDAQQARWGTGGPGFTIKDEFYCADGSVSYTHPATCPGGQLGLKHDKAGVLSMANTGRPQTGGSQFFLTAVATPWLDGKHAVFGEAADQESLDVILAIN